LPPLRERGADIVRLAEAFLARFGARYQRGGQRFAPSALRALEAYAWPGNVRELSHVIERSVLMHEGDVIDADALNLKAAAGPAPAAAGASGLSVDEAEERVVREAMERTGGNIQRAATLLGLSRPALYRRLEKYGIGVR
jgi:DNA-binding NtrC family response regulator